MSGPLPKSSAVRQRKNKAASRALLPPERRRLVSSPQLPTHPDREKWHPLARQFWTDVWRSPMASQYLEADLHGLFRMLILTDLFMKEPTVPVSAELRLLSQNYGLSPIDRRRLEWTIAKTEDAVREIEHKRAQRAPMVSVDPREVLDE